MILAGLIGLSALAWSLVRFKSYQKQLNDLKINSQEKLEQLRTELEAKRNESIQGMIDEIVQLMDIQKEKVRMERELETAKYVQDNMLIGKNFEDKNIRIGIHHVSSSECSGDWWYYGYIAGQFYVMIGDATGHGVPAALVTATVRSALALIETYQKMNPAELLKILNRCIYQSSKGNINMTFFVLAYDAEEKKISYSNASHEPPIFLKQNTKSQLLMGAIGQRLGESLDFEVENEVISVNASDKIVLYTDGVSEYINEKKRHLSEVDFIKILEKVNIDSDKSVEPEKKLSEILKINNYRILKENRRNIDDVAVMFVDIR